MKKFCSCLLLMTYLSLPASDCDKVVLLDTTDSKNLDWVRHSNFATSGATEGWLEESYPHYDQGTTVNWRSYVVCDVNEALVDNWLRTPFISRGDADRLYIEIKFSMRDCTHFPTTVRSCKETFTLFYYQSDLDIADSHRPSWNPQTYTSIGRIAADTGRFSDNNEVRINTETASIPVTKNGVYFAFRDEGSCLSLLAVKVYYIVCRSVTANFATFPTTPTGAEVASIKQVTGTCVNNSVELRTPSYLCTGAGEWDVLTGICECLPGYQAVETEGKYLCNACPRGMFKFRQGNTKCRFCPKHSEVERTAAKECPCDRGYYRAKSDDRSKPCTQPPSAPRHLEISAIDKTAITLIWRPPEYDGGRDDVHYRIACDICGHSVTYSPSQAKFNETQLTASGLTPGTTYRFTIYAENGVSSQTRVPPFADKTVMTLQAARAPSEVENVSARQYGAAILLEWDSPPEPSYKVREYEIKYYPSSDISNISTVLTSEKSHVFDGLQPDVEYGFQVKARMLSGWGSLSEPVFLTMPTGNDVKEESNIPIIAGVVAAGYVSLMLIVVCIVVIVKKHRRKMKEAKFTDVDSFDYRSGEGLTPLYACRPKSYIDPHTYEDPSLLISDFAKEIDPGDVLIEAVIGGGEFGDVCRGRLYGKMNIPVAIKTLKVGASERSKRDFLLEASIMGQFDHSNVIKLIGVATKTTPVMIITELMENGSLDLFLRTVDGQLQCIQLVHMLHGIASGMAYLADMAYVHRDLAARNVLINENLCCKISDFGLSREMESNKTDCVYTTIGGKIPIRWTAPEAIAYRKFTTASDIWSYGIVMWEVISYGERPYWNWSNQDVVKAVERNYRLPPPMGCPDAIYQIMSDCWNKDRTLRPSFATTVCNLQNLMQKPESLKQVAKSRFEDGYDPLSSKYFHNFSSVDEWLDSIKMGRYKELFHENQFTTPENISTLNEKELSRIGVTLPGHQKKLMSAVHHLRDQLSQTVGSDHSFLV